MSFLLNVSPFYYVAIVGLVALSAFFSAAEMAFASANRIRLENAAENGDKSAKVACAIFDRYEDMLSTVLICNNLVNIAASSIASVIALLLVGDGNSGLATTIASVTITLLIIVFSETIPKIVAKKNANRYSTSFAYIIRGLMFILKPILFVIVGAISLITKPFKGERPVDEQEAAALELVSIIETVEGEGVIDEERSELLQAALDFSDISASEIMTSRVDMLSIDIDDDWDEIMDTILSSSYSRLPVYEDSIDNIIGVLYLNHFFKAISGAEQIDIRPLLLTPCFVYKTLKLPAVLAEMRKSRTHIAIVTDEYGGSMGLVTMEDVFEELVGEIWDETDAVEEEVIERAENLYELDGDMNMGDFLEMLDWDENAIETESATVGGWTIESLEHFPVRGEKMSYENLTLIVLEVSGQRVERVLVKVGDPKTK